MLTLSAHDIDRRFKALEKRVAALEPGGLSTGAPEGDPDAPLDRALAAPLPVDDDEAPVAKPKRKKR